MTDFNFYHEYLAKDIESMKRSLKIAQKKLDNPLQRSMILWGISQAIESKSLHWFNSTRLKVYLSGQYSIYAFDAILDAIDAEAESYGYTLDLDATRWSDWDRTYCLVYERNHTKTFTVLLESASCRQEPTGKMVATTKVVCNMVNQ